MKSKDQLLLEAAYQEVSTQIKGLFNQMMPLAEKILGNERRVVWDLDEEDKAGEFGHFTQFGLRRISTHPGSPKTTPSIEFGNWHNEQLWGSEISPHATTPKKYTAIYKVLLKKYRSLKESLEHVNEEQEEQDFSYYSGPVEDIMFLDDIKDVSNLKRKVEEGKKFKTAFVASKSDAVNYGYSDQSGFDFYVFYTPQDFTRPALIPI